MKDFNTIYLAGGCFWGVQKFFDQFGGVISTEVGYANGPVPSDSPEFPVSSDSSGSPASSMPSVSPVSSLSYQDVCSGSGHAETVKIVYDADKISLTRLIELYFMIIDPLSLNRQGGDTGIQYRTGIYYTRNEQLGDIEAVFHKEEEKARKQDPKAKLAVEVLPLENFFTAEEYHQKYLDKNPGGYCHIPPEKFRLGEM